MVGPRRSPPFLRLETRGGSDRGDRDGGPAPNRNPLSVLFTARPRDRRSSLSLADSLQRVVSTDAAPRARAPPRNVTRPAPARQVSGSVAARAVTSPCRRATCILVIRAERASGHRPSFGAALFLRKPSHMTWQAVSFIFSSLHKWNYNNAWMYVSSDYYSPILLSQEQVSTGHQPAKRNG